MPGSFLWTLNNLFNYNLPVDIFVVWFLFLLVNIIHLLTFLPIKLNHRSAQFSKYIDDKTYTFKIAY